MVEASNSVIFLYQNRLPYGGGEDISVLRTVLPRGIAYRIGISKIVR